MTITLLDVSHDDHRRNEPAAPAHVSLAPDYAQDVRQYRRIYALCFAVFLLVALFARLLPRQWRPFASVAGTRASVIDEARAAVANILPFVFMA